MLGEVKIVEVAVKGKSSILLSAHANVHHYHALHHYYFVISMIVMIIIRRSNSLWMIGSQFGLIWVQNLKIKTDLCAKP